MFYIELAFYIAIRCVASRKVYSDAAIVITFYLDKKPINVMARCNKTRTILL